MDVVEETIVDKLIEDNQVFQDLLQKSYSLMAKRCLLKPEHTGHADLPPGSIKLPDIPLPTF
jgi:hypothetical protein